MESVTVAQLRKLLADFQDDATVYVQRHIGDTSALIAIASEDSVDYRRGRFATGDDTIVVLERIS